VRGSISGIPPTPAGAQAPQSAILFYPLNPSIPTPLTFNGPVIAVRPDENGSFDKDTISPGAYMIYAAAGNRRARVPIELRDRDLNGLNIVLSAGTSISGRIVVEGTTGSVPDRLAPSVRILLMTDPIAGGFRETPASAAFAPPGNPTADGLFTIASPPNPNYNGPVLLPGDYRVFVPPLLNPAVGWADPPSRAGGVNLYPEGVPPLLQNAYVKSIRFGERDVLKDGLSVPEQSRDSLVITIGRNAGSLEERVLNTAQKPVGAATVVLIPENNLRFQINHKVITTDIDGRFQLNGIAPGDYKLFAWEQAERGSWQDPEFVGKYESQGKTIHVDEGSKLSIEVNSIAP